MVVTRCWSDSVSNAANGAASDEHRAEQASGEQVLVGDGLSQENLRVMRGSHGWYAWYAWYACGTGAEADGRRVGV